MIYRSIWTPLVGRCVTATYVVVVIGWATTSWNDLLEHGWSGVALLGIVTVTAFLSSAKTATAMHRLVDRSEAVDVADLTGQTFTLYLRPFARDKAMSRKQRVPFPFGAVRTWVTEGITEEMHLVNALSCRDAVAVGLPGEELPRLGARRVRLSDGDWQDQVRRLMLNAESVIILAGTSEGVLWELSAVTRWSTPGRFTLVVAMDRPEYEDFRDTATTYLNQHRRRSRRIFVRLPAFEAPDRSPRSQVTGIVTFDAHWQGRFVPLQPSRPFYNPLSEMIHDALLRCRESDVVEEEGRTTSRTASAGDAGSTTDRSATVLPSSILNVTIVLVVAVVVMVLVLGANLPASEDFGRTISLNFGPFIILYMLSAMALWIRPRSGRSIALSFLVLHLVWTVVRGEEIKLFRVPYEIATLYVPALALAVLFCSRGVRQYRD